MCHWKHPVCVCVLRYREIGSVKNVCESLCIRERKSLCIGEREFMCLSVSLRVFLWEEYECVS